MIASTTSNSTSVNARRLDRDEKWMFVPDGRITGSQMAATAIEVERVESGFHQQKPNFAPHRSVEYRTNGRTKTRPRFGDPFIPQS
jgi:hypothetical protein